MKDLPQILAEIATTAEGRRAIRAACASLPPPRVREHKIKLKGGDEWGRPWAFCACGASVACHAASLSLHEAEKCPVLCDAKEVLRSPAGGVGRVQWGKLKGYNKAEHDDRDEPPTR
jgi:hypothetical protein